MKIYSKKEFLKLPPGTIFSSGEPYCFAGLYIKGESFRSDFYECSLIDINSTGEEWADVICEMEENKISVPINQMEGREGLFDDELLYLLYEKEDLEYMIKKFKEAIDGMDHC